MKQLWSKKPVRTPEIDGNKVLQTVEKSKCENFELKKIIINLVRKKVNITNLRASLEIIDGVFQIGVQLATYTVNKKW